MIESTTLVPPAAAHPRAAERREVRALLAAAVDAFREGRTAEPPPRQFALTDGQLNEELLAYVYAHLERSDHASLAKLGSIRERALTLSRAGQQQEAEATMRAARFYLSAIGFSPLGRAAADTLQYAAEAYLSYRRSDFDDANARMSAAVAATDRLADAWGESLFTTARRVHLLHNQLRVEARRGAAREAMVLGAGILALLTGSPARFGLPAPGRPAPPESLIADNFCDAVTATLTEVLAGVPDGEAKELLGLLDGLAPRDVSSTARVWEWIPLKHAALEADPRRFLAEAAPFLRTGRGRAPALWFAVALDVVRIARGMDEGAAVEGIAEIEAALATEAKVPATMRRLAAAA